MVCKGALTNALEISSPIMVSGEAKPLTSGDQDSIGKLYRKWSNERYRVLGSATKTFDAAAILGAKMRPV